MARTEVFVGHGIHWTWGVHPVSGMFHSPTASAHPPFPSSCFSTASTATESALQLSGPSCCTACALRGHYVSVDATHLLMASEVSDVVGMKAVPQTPQGPRAMYGYITPAFSGSP